jgi:phage-related protein
MTHGRDQHHDPFSLNFADDPDSIVQAKVLSLLMRSDRRLPIL